MFLVELAGDGEGPRFEATPMQMIVMSLIGYKSLPSMALFALAISYAGF